MYVYSNPWERINLTITVVIWVYAELPTIFQKGAKNISWRKDSLFNKCFWENWIFACRKLKLDPCLSPCPSINLKWINNLTVRPETLKLVQEIHWS
jgi:hypothetical protein